jgi:HK97 family phage major capsid protein
VATVRTIGRESLEVRTRTAQFSANWQGEVAARNETTGLTFGLERIPTHELCARVDVSNWDLEDSDYNFEQILNEEFGERFGVAEGTSFISGNTTTQPEGMLQNANVGTSNSGNATVLTADGFVTAYFTPKSAYTSNFKWLMRRSTMAAAAALKNNNADYMLRRLGEGPVWTIMGADVIECPDVPAVANAAYPVIYGDFRRGYTIVDRVGLTILRDPYTAANTGSVIFYARKRVGGKVVMAEAIYKMLVTA